MCESRTKWVTPPVTECNHENLSRTGYASSKGPSLPLHVPPEECPLLSDTEVQKLCSHVPNQTSHRHVNASEDACGKSSLFLHSRDDCKRRDYYLEKNPSPPKAIVMPLIGGVVHSKTHAVDTSQRSEHLPLFNSSSRDLVCSCQCHSKTLTSMKAICDLKSSTQARNTIDGSGWKNHLEEKDKMLAEKNHLIERQKQSIASLQKQLMDAKRFERDCKTNSPWIKIDELQASINCMKICEAEESKDKELQSGNKVLLEETREECRSLNRKLVALQLENDTLTKECQKLQKLLFESEVHSHQELQAMRERHKQRFVEATAELRLRHRAMAKRVKALEVQLLKNTDIVSALNSELQISHGAIGDLKLSVKELVVQNQHLVEENVSLQESTAKVLDVKTSNDAAEQQTRQLIVELAYCVEDLKSLVSLCLSLLEGSDLSVSQTLGAACLDKVTASEQELDLESSVRNKLAEVKHLTAVVDKLREIVSEQFATRVSNACHVQ